MNGKSLLLSILAILALTAVTADAFALTLHPGRELHWVKPLETWFEDTEIGVDVMWIEQGQPTKVKFMVQNHAYNPTMFANYAGSPVGLQNVTYIVQIVDEEGRSMHVSTLSNNTLQPRGVVTISEDLPDNIISNPGKYQAQLMVWWTVDRSGAVEIVPVATKITKDFSVSLIR